MQVLLVEDDDRVGQAISDVLTYHGFRVLRARTAAQGLHLLGPAVDVVVLDLGLPDRDGFELCARIRRERDVPIIVATARGELSARVHGLHLGADDYLVKPFDIRELMARIHAVTRRARHATAPAAPAGGPAPAGNPGPGDGRPPAGAGAPAGEAPAGAAAPALPGPGALASPGVLRCGNLVIDRPRRAVEVDGRPIALSRKEFDLLALLAEKPGAVYRREQIMSAVWQARWAGGRRTLEVHVASIRAKTGCPGLIETVRGVGYRLSPASGGR
jgi:DNA-binding response OmpR family regulator